MTQWTKTPPSAPGNYFWRPIREPDLMEIAYLGKHGHFSYMACGASTQPIVHAEPKEWWPIPIQEPEKP